MTNGVGLGSLVRGAFLQLHDLSHLGNLCTPGRLLLFRLLVPVTGTIWKLEDCVAGLPVGGFRSRLHFRLSVQWRLHVAASWNRSDIAHRFL